MLRRAVVGFLVVVALAAAIPCLGVADDPAVGGELRIAISGSPPTLDWHKTNTLFALYICSHIYEELLVYDQFFGVIPQLAKSWEVSDDGLIYTFVIRDGVSFHNGEILDAEDVEASIGRFLDVSIRAGALANIASVQAIDKDQLEIRLSEPDAFFLYTLTDMLVPVAIMPASVVEAEKAGEPLELVGTGPYRFVEWVPEQYIHLSRFEPYIPDPRYAKGEDRGFGGYREAFIDDLYFVPVSDSGARVAGLETGEYSWIDDVPMPLANQLESSPGMKVGYINPNGFLTSYVNLSLPPTDNLEIRRAIQIGIDVEKICAIAGEGTYSLFAQFWDPTSVWSSDAGDIYYNVNDKERARSLLAKAGYAGEPVLVVTNSTYEVLYRLGVALADELRQMGVNAQLRVYDWPTALSVIVEQPKNWHFWMTFWVMETLSPAGMPSALNYSFYDDREEFNAEFNRFKTSTPDDFHDIIDALQLVLYEDVPLLHFGGFAAAQAWTDELVGFRTWRIARFWNTSLND